MRHGTLCGLASVIKTFSIGVSTPQRMDGFQFGPNNPGVARFSNFKAKTRAERAQNHAAGRGHQSCAHGAVAQQQCSPEWVDKSHANNAGKVSISTLSRSPRTCTCTRHPLGGALFETVPAAGWLSWRKVFKGACCSNLLLSYTIGTSGTSGMSDARAPKSATPVMSASCCRWLGSGQHLEKIPLACARRSQL